MRFKDTTLQGCRRLSDYQTPTVSGPTHGIGTDVEGVVTTATGGSKEIAATRDGVGATPEGYLVGRDASTDTAASTSRDGGETEVTRSIGGENLSVCAVGGGPSVINVPRKEFEIVTHGSNAYLAVSSGAGILEGNPCRRVTRLEDGQGVFIRATVANVQGKLGRCGQNAQTVVGRVVEEVVRATEGRSSRSERNAPDVESRQTGSTRSHNKGARHGHGSRGGDGRVTEGHSRGSTDDSDRGNSSSRGCLDVGVAPLVAVPEENLSGSRR